ncbi:hypothetical protein ACIBO1_14750 [Micromonospora sp. NPDC049903]|uniref:hypothetical protein n=1 Tax=Micromonospora sp. NPDC049903 TaxID=3364276 RepID=UPI0037B96858
MAVMPWQPFSQPGSPTAPRSTLTAHPVDPLPPRVTPPDESPQPRRTPAGAWLFVVVALAAGSRWGAELLGGWAADLPTAEGPSGLAAELLRALLHGLTWARWELEPERSSMVGYWLSENLRTLFFVAGTVWLLRWLATRSAPAAAYRAYAVLGAATVTAVLAAFAGGLVGLLVVPDDLVLHGDPRWWVDTTITGALLAGLVYGPALAVAAMRSEARPRRVDGGWPG